MQMSDDAKQTEFDWASTVALLIHPMKVMILEALISVGQPLTTRDLQTILRGRYSMSHVSYHVDTLAKVGIVTQSDGSRDDRRRKRTHSISDQFFV